MENNEIIWPLHGKKLNISNVLLLEKTRKILALWLMDQCDEKLINIFENLMTYPKSLRAFEEAFDLYKSKLIKWQKHVELANKETLTTIRISYQKDWLWEKIIITRTHPKEKITDPFTFDNKISHHIKLYKERLHLNKKDDHLSPWEQLKKVFAFKLEPKSIEIWDFSKIGKNEKILSYEY